MLANRHEGGIGISALGRGRGTHNAGDEQAGVGVQRDVLSLDNHTERLKRLLSNLQASPWRFGKWLSWAAQNLQKLNGQPG